MLLIQRSFSTAGLGGPYAAVSDLVEITGSRASASASPENL